MSHRFHKTSHSVKKKTAYSIRVQRIGYYAGLLDVTYDTKGEAMKAISELRKQNKVDKKFKSIRLVKLKY